MQTAAAISTPLAASDPLPRELLRAVREIVRYALMTLAAIPDPDKKFIGWKSSPSNLVRGWDAYGYGEANGRFRPTRRHIAQMEIILPWLIWLRQRDELAARRLISWASGTPIWILAERDKCSIKTIHNRIDRSISAMIKKFLGVGIDIEFIEEPPENSWIATNVSPPGPHGQEVRNLKVYIGGGGMWKNGRYLRDGQHRADKFMNVA